MDSKSPRWLSIHTGDFGLIHASVSMSELTDDLIVCPDEQPGKRC